MGKTSPVREYLFGVSRPARPMNGARAASLVREARKAAAALADVRTRRLLDLFDALGARFADPADPLRGEVLRRLPTAVGFSPEMIDLGFSVIAGFLSREALLARLRGELRAEDPCALLDGFAPGEHFAGRERAAPLGVVLNVAPGNVFVSAADAIVSALLMRNALIFKCPSEDPHFPVLFAEALRDLDRGGPVSSALAVVSWKGGDAPVEDAFKAAVDAALVWGGEAAVAAWRAGTPAACRLVEYGPKYSFAFVDLAACRTAADLRALASGLATDAATWDGHACSSPQCAFVVDSNRYQSKDLREALAAAFEALAAELPPGPRSLDEKVEIRRLIERGRVDPLFGRGGASGDGIAGLAVEDTGSGLPVSPKNRVILLRVVPSAEAAAGIVRPHRGLLQAAGLHVRPRDRDRIAALFAAAGANRVTAVGRMRQPDEGAPHDGRHPLADLVRFVTIEEEGNGKERDGRGSTPAPRWGRRPQTPIACAPLLRERAGAGRRETGVRGSVTPDGGRGAEPPAGPSSSLPSLLAAAVRAPFYRRRLAGIDLAHATFADLSRIVPVTREEVHGNAPPASNALLARSPSAASVFASGGSKGAPKYAYYSAEEFAASTDALAFIYAKAGLGPGDVVGNLFLAGSLWTSFLVCHAAVEKAGAVNLPVAGNAPVEESLAHLVAMRANALVGLPSILLRLAEAVERTGAPLRAAKILYGGEHLYPDAVAYLKRTLGAKAVRSAGYATVDCGPVGWQCARLPGTLHHALDFHCHVGIVDGAGRPCEAGRTGEIVVTNLVRTLQPVIRFRTGDLGRWEGRACRCGDPSPVFRLLGRADDMLVIGGMNLAPGDVAEAVAGLPGLTSAFSLAADTVGRAERLTVLLESNANGAKAREAARRAAEARLRSGRSRIGAALSAGWLPSLVVRVVGPEGIPRNRRTGKVVTIVDRRKTQ